MTKIIYFTHTSSIGGASGSLKQLIDGVLERDRYAVKVVLPKAGDLPALLEEDGVDVIVDRDILPLMTYPNTKSLWNPITWYWLRKMFAGIRAARKICERDKPNIVHINSSVLFHLAMGAKQAGVPKVILHLRENWALKIWDFREWVKRFICKKYVDVLIGICKAAIKKFGFQEKSVVVHNWPDFAGRDDQWDMRAEMGIPSQAHIILVPSGRNRKKGTLRVLEAIRNCRTKVPFVVVVLGGRFDGNRKKALIRSIVDFFGRETYGMRIDSMAKLFGNKIRLVDKTFRMKAAIEESTLVISPFTVPHFSKPVIEAGCLKTPVIASDDNFSREIVDNRETGLLVDAEDSHSIAEAMDILLEDLEYAKRLGENLQRTVVAEFSKEESIKAVCSIYDHNNLLISKKV